MSMLNLKKDIKTIKITADPDSYSSLLFGQSKIGKSTFVKNLYGKNVLFLMTEPRDRALVGEDVAHVTNWIDFIAALNQLKRDKDLQKRYKVIAIDTVDNLVRFVEDYAKEHYQEKELGNASFGKDYKFAKDQWNKYVTSIHDIGYTPIYVAHEKDATIRVAANEASRDNLGNNVEEVREGSKLFYEFTQKQPDLPQKYMNPIKKSVDQILYLTSMFINSEEKRVIHLRKSPQWIAGSTFPKIKPTIIDNAKIYRQTLKDAVNYYDKKDQTNENYNKPAKKTNFKKLMKTAKELGYKAYQQGKLTDLKQITEDIFGPDMKLMEAKESQSQQVEVAIMRIKKLVA